MRVCGVPCPLRRIRCVGLQARPSQDSDDAAAAGIPPAAKSIPRTTDNEADEVAPEELGVLRAELGASVCRARRERRGAGFCCVRHGDATCPYRVVGATAADITEWHMGQRSFPTTLSSLAGH